MPRRQLQVAITLHAFDKLRAFDLSLAEFERLLQPGEIIERHRLSPGHLKKVVLTTSWTRPLHVAIIVDEFRAKERIITVYEPDPLRWSRDSRERRR